MIYLSLLLLLAAAVVYAQVPTLEQYQISELQRWQRHVENQHFWITALLVSNLVVLVANLLKDRWKK